MVTIKIVIEGGVLPHANVAALTINNSEKLRERFYKLFTQVDHLFSFLQVKDG